MEVTNPSHFGVTTFGKPELEEMAYVGDPQRKITVTRAHGEWRRPERLAPFLSSDFVLPIDCVTAPDGLRRIVPRCNFESLIDLGVVGGVAVIHGMRGFNEDFHETYRNMLLIHQHVRGRDYLGTRGMQQHLTREFKSSRDLYVRRSGRLADGERDVLPDDIGVTAQGEGHRLSITQLTKRGREAGCRNSNSKHAIKFGLYEAAKMNPLEVESEKVSTLVQLALFDMDEADGVPSPELIETVTERLLEALDAHLPDSQEAFKKWFFGPNNSIIKQIAQQKRKPGGMLCREDVRRVLLHLAWQAYAYIGPCVHAFMWTVKMSIPEPLNDEEKQLFEHMHESQPYFGNLPAAMLAERSRFLGRAVLAIWDEPQNPEHVRVLHRLLQYYGEMVRPRRAADRQSKRRSPGPDDATGTAAEKLASEDDRLFTKPQAGGDTQLIENMHSPTSAGADPFVEVADHLRQLRRIECQAGCTRWEYRRVGESKKSVTIGLRCECGQVERSIRMTVDHFADQAEKVLGWQRQTRRDLSEDGEGPSHEN